MRHLALLLVCATARAETVAAVPFLSVGVDDEAAAELAEDLAEAAATRSGGKAARLAAPVPLGDDCPEDEACLRALAARLHADVVLLTVATAPAEGPVLLSVSRIQDGRVAMRTQAIVPEEPEGRALALQRMAHVLMPQPALSADTASPAPTASRPASRSTRWIWIAAGAIAVGTGIVLAASLGGDDEPETATLPPQTLGTFGPGAPAQ